MSPESGIGLEPNAGRDGSVYREHVHETFEGHEGVRVEPGEARVRVAGGDVFVVFDAPTHAVVTGRHGGGF
jgi:hypothetical protein